MDNEPQIVSYYLKKRNKKAQEEDQKETTGLSPYHLMHTL